MTDEKRRLFYARIDGFIVGFGVGCIVATHALWFIDSVISAVSK